MEADLNLALVGRFGFADKRFRTPLEISPPCRVTKPTGVYLNGVVKRPAPLKTAVGLVKAFAAVA